MSQTDKQMVVQTTWYLIPTDPFLLLKGLSMEGEQLPLSLATSNTKQTLGEL